MTRIAAECTHLTQAVSRAEEETHISDESTASRFYVRDVAQWLNWSIVLDNN